MKRVLLGVLLSLGGLTATPAGAIVALCPNGFQNCDPYTGACYTAWTGTKSGVLKPDCTVDPSSCWTKALTLTCPDPLPPPVTPGAFRVCPWGVDCGVGYPPHPIDQYIPGVRAQAGTVIYYYQGHPGITGPVLPPSIDVNLVLDCILYHFASSPLGDGLACPPGSNSWSGRIVRPPTAVFEPAPACVWSIAPTSPVQPCVLPQAALIAAMKNETQWTGVANYYRSVQTRYVRLMRNLSAGKYGAWPEARFNLAQGRFLWLSDLLALLAPLLLDPPSTNYAFFPAASTTYPLVTLPTADATMTAAQIAQHGTWLNAVREVAIVTKQLGETMDNLAGAVLAAEAGTPDAALWVYLLATHWDAVAATVAQKGALEVAARAGITGPVVVEDATCATPTDAVNALKAAVQHGNTLYGGHLVYDDLLGGPCAPAATFPALLTDDGGANAAAYAGLATVGAAAFVCAANPAYCVGATLSVTPALDFGSVPVGTTSAWQTVTVQNRGLVPITLGLATLGGTNPTQYKISPLRDTCSGHTLAPQAVCALDVRFKPTGLGLLIATVKLPSALPVVQKVKLSGTGL